MDKYAADLLCDAIEFDLEQIAIASALRGETIEIDLGEGVTDVAARAARGSVLDIRGDAPRCDPSGTDVLGPPYGKAPNGR